MVQTQGRPHGYQKILRTLWEVMAIYRWRIGGALLFLILAKVSSVGVPLLLKRIVDTLSRPEQLTALPVYLLAGYAAVRFLSTLFTELRDLLFSRVTQHTVATFAHNVFTHLHELGSRFHAQRRIGGLLPDIDRGTNGISFLLGVGLFTLVPTLIEIGMVLAIMGSRYSGWYTAIISATFLFYTGFTVVFTSRRTIYQRRVNKLDSSAKSRLADSLINYDSVKYFTNESLEARRFEGIMDRWAGAVLANQKALFILHVGQSSIIALGVASVMLLAGEDVLARGMTVGDLVLINAYMLQICLPLNALGFVYREMKDAMVNAEKLFQLLRERPEIEEPDNLPPLQVKKAAVCFENVSFHYDPERAILHNVSFQIPPGKPSPWLAVAALESRRWRACCCASMTWSTVALPWMARTFAASAPKASAAPLVWCRRTRSCSTIASLTTSAMVAAARRKRTLSPPPRPHMCTTSSLRCHSAMKRRWASAGSSFQGASDSALRWHAPC
jgi:ATP-binding cassette subfamily B protein